MSETVVMRITMIDDDAELTQASTTLLRRELSRLEGVERVDPSAVPAPPDARAGELAELGVLLALIASHAQIVIGVLTAVGDWLRRRGGGRVEIRVGDDELILENATPDDQRSLVEAFVKRVIPPAP